MSSKLIEKTLSTVEVFKGKFLKVMRDDVELPSGQKAFREYIQHPGAAMIIPLFPDGRILLVRQYRHALKKIFLEFPAGKIDQGETTEQTAHRELKEETGLTAGNMKWLTTIHPVIGFANERIELYLATDLTIGEQKLDHGEELELVYYQLPELLEMIRQHDVTDVKTQIGILWLEKILSKKWE